MLLFNTYTTASALDSPFQNISCYCLTNQPVPNVTAAYTFQNISCYCLTIEKTSFFNFFFQKNNDFIIFFNVFTNHPFNFPLFQKTTYSSLSYYFFKKSLGKILITSFIFSFQTLPIMNPINQICNHNIQTNIQT